MTALDERTRGRLVGWPSAPWVVSSVASLAVFVALWLGLAARDWLPPRVDVQVLADLMGGPGLWVTGARMLSWLGFAGVVVTGTAVTSWVLWRRGAAWLAVWLVVVVSTGWASTQLVKLVARRARPPTNGDLSFAKGFSFPSGHASVGIYAFGGLAVVLALALPGRRRWWWVCGVAATGAAIGGSRLVLGVHWLTDVLAGWALGLLVLSVGVLVVLRFRR